MKLSRKQKTFRNVAAVVLLLALAWAIQGFGAFTTAQAVRWRAMEYGLTEGPEILYASDWDDRGRRDVVFRCGDQLGVTQVYKTVLCRARTMAFYEEQPVTLLYQTDAYEAAAIMLYCSIPEAATAECSLRLHGMVNNEVFEETYDMRAEVNENGVCRFAIVPKHTGKWTEDTEITALRDFQLTAEDGRARDSRHSVSVVIRNSAGEVIGNCVEKLHP